MLYENFLNDILLYCSDDLSLPFYKELSDDMLKSDITVGARITFSIIGPHARKIIARDENYFIDNSSTLGEQDIISRIKEKWTLFSDIQKAKIWDYLNGMLAICLQIDFK
jgi:hypothetical protein